MLRSLIYLEFIKGKQQESIFFCSKTRTIYEDTVLWSMCILVLFVKTRVAVGVMTLLILFFFISVEHGISRIRK